MIKKIELNDYNLRALFNAEIDSFIKSKIKNVESYLQNEDLFKRDDFERLLNRKVDNVTSLTITASPCIQGLLTNLAYQPRFRAAAVNIDKMIGHLCDFHSDNEINREVAETEVKFKNKELYGVSCSFMSYDTGTLVWVSYLSKEDDLEEKSKIIFSEVLKERASDILDTNNEIKNINQFVKERIKNDVFEESTLEGSVYLSNFRKSILEEVIDTNPQNRQLRKVRI